tara:strand:- start:927 stop:1304 length:378 start_codon:yes stop_codon:yes gene_type:complete
MFNLNLENMIPIFGSHVLISKESLKIKDDIIQDSRSELIGYKKAYEGLSDTYNKLDIKFNILAKKYEETCIENVSLASEIKEVNKNLMALRKESDGKSQRKTTPKTNRQKNQNSRTKNKKPVKKA